MPDRPFGRQRDDGRQSCGACAPYGRRARDPVARSLEDELGRRHRCSRRRLRVPRRRRPGALTLISLGRRWPARSNPAGLPCARLSGVDAISMRCGRCRGPSNELPDVRLRQVRAAERLASERASSATSSERVCKRARAGAGPSTPEPAAYTSSIPSSLYVLRSRHPRRGLTRCVSRCVAWL